MLFLKQVKHLTSSRILYELKQQMPASASEKTKKTELSQTPEKILTEENKYKKKIKIQNLNPIPWLQILLVK